MAEVHRILKPGKRFSCCVPNIKYFLNGYTEPDVFAAKMKNKVYEPALQYYSPVDWVNYLAYMRGEHKHLFDDENLTILMKEAGYVDVSSRGFGHEKDMPGRREQSIYAEGYKAIS